MRELEGRAARLRADDGEEQMVTIVSADGEQLVLVLPVTPSTALAGRAVLEYASLRGVHRVHGRLSGDARPGIVTLLRDGGEIVQRRDWVRVDAVRPVRLAVAGQLVHTFTRNLSAGGALVVDPLALDAGEEVALALALVDGEAPIEIRGPVTVARDGAAAVRFDIVAADDRERIVRWAVERQREALRTARR